MSAVVLILVTALLGISLAAIPSNYILQVAPVCGSDGIEDAQINVVTDLQASAVAECADGVKIDFTSQDGVNYRAPVSYPGGGSNECVFIKRDEAEVYLVKVLVSYGEPGNYIHQEQEEFTVTCLFNAKGNEESGSSNIRQGLIAPKEIQNLQGESSSSVVTLQLTDVLGDDISARRVWRSRKVQLKATTSGSDGELGLRPVGCDAIGQSGARYAVLRAGCGDGIIFEKDAGFITDGLVLRSPYFEAFGIEGDLELSFECNFTACTENCNGSSCVNVRKRRSVSSGKAPPVMVTARQSRPIHLRPFFTEPDLVVSQSPPLRVDQTSRDVHTTSALYWTAILGLGLIVLTSFAVSVTACSGSRRVKIGDWNKA